MTDLIDNGYIGTLVDMKYCLDCGAEKSRKGNYCKPCGYKHRQGSGFRKGHPFYAGGESGWFKKGHIPWSKGMKSPYIVTEETGKKLSIASKARVTDEQREFMRQQGRLHKGITGAASPAWKGDGVGYTGLHYWVRKELGKPTQCEHCGTTARVEWANKSQTYKRELTDWVQLCKKCHSRYDWEMTGARASFYSKGVEN